MRSISLYIATTILMAAPGAGLAQKWELGAVAGGGFYSKASVTSPAGSGDVGFKSGPAYGAFLGSNMYKYVGGELRYEYRPGDLKVSSGGAQATFNGEAHAIHYDLLLHFRPIASRIRPFVAGGGGVKLFRGTGAATATQPLSRLALLTNTHEVKGLGSVGGGIKASLSSRVMLRVEARDFITPFPQQVIAPSIGGKISGLLHDFVVTGGLAITFE